MLQLSDRAVEALRDLGALRVTAEEVDGEVELELEPADEPHEGDAVVEQDGARIFLDPLAAETLTELVLDVEPHGDHVHFGFSPQEGAEPAES
jgi:Fe-S cluster assembly iron-binding protein IscA